MNLYQYHNKPEELYRENESDNNPIAIMDRYGSSGDISKYKKLLRRMRNYLILDFLKEKKQYSKMKDIKNIIHVCKKS